MDDADQTLITARSKREALDFALVLASQKIDSAVVQTDDGWAVAVDSYDYNIAWETLALWERENRGWNWPRKLPKIAGRLFHPGSVIWAVAVAAIYTWSLFGGIKEAGTLDSQKVGAGHWWLYFTAVSLHADLAHLFSNLSSGLLLVGLAMGRYGGGIGVLAAYLAGVMGNIVAQWVYTQHYYALGASGMVMGALGLLAIVPPEDGWNRKSWLGIVLRGVAATFLMLVLIGFSPESDVVAHVGGYVGGLALGLILSRVPPRIVHDSVSNLAATAILLATGSWS